MRLQPQGGSLKGWDLLFEVGQLVFILGAWGGLFRAWSRYSGWGSTRFPDPGNRGVLCFNRKLCLFALSKKKKQGKHGSWLRGEVALSWRGISMTDCGVKWWLDRCSGKTLGWGVGWAQLRGGSGRRSNQKVGWRLQKRLRPVAARGREEGI